MTATPTAQQLVEALLGLPAQLDRIEEAAIARRPIDVTITEGEPAPTGYVMEPTEFDLLNDLGEKVGRFYKRYDGWSWNWDRGDQSEGTWELHQGVSPTREDAVAAIIEQRIDPDPYRGEAEASR